MIELSAQLRRTLRSRAHHLHPYLSIGAAGLTAALLREIDRCLKSHELIKIRALTGERHERERLIDEICSALGAFPVQQIGKILLIFRPRPAEPAAPATPRPQRENVTPRSGRRRHAPGRRQSKTRPGKLRRT